ncbi:hypothetical protein ACIGXM_16670 [Kitasatospora sp. NPDC052896]|uniref:hypothetical protein n=1 Tax=Kitasatospora sp. NPDC052896 TaxID=3364061 RepID=UPI0037C8794D
MTAPGARRPLPGSAVSATRPLVALWTLLLIGLLTVLPCAGTARAATPASAGAQLAGPDATPGTVAPRPAPAAAVPRAAAHTPAHAPASGEAVSAVPALPASLFLCSPGDPPPAPGDGCSSHSCNGQEAQLPNAPPQPEPATAPVLVIPGPGPVLAPSAAAPDSGPAPDLHLLQVNRT